MKGRARTSICPGSKVEKMRSLPSLRAPSSHALGTSSSLSMFASVLASSFSFLSISSVDLGKGAAAALDKFGEVQSATTNTASKKRVLAIISSYSSFRVRFFG